MLSNENSHDIAIDVLITAITKAVVLPLFKIMDGRSLTVIVL